MSRFKNVPDVICADGLPVEPGDTVWRLSDRSPIIVTFVDYVDGYASGYYVETGARLYNLKPEALTHDDPCDGDSWERFEEKLCYLLDDGDLAHELTERAKALAEKEN